MLAVLVLLGGSFLLFLATPALAAVPAGFEEKAVASVESPTALAFTPDGRLLVTSKTGQLHVYDQSGNELSSLDIGDRVCANVERGLLGVAVPPDFGTTDNHVYLYYTYKKHGVCPEKQPARNDNPVNRVSRFEMTGNVVDGESEEILIDNIPSPNGNHNAGDLHFGDDGKLYVSVGDGGCNYRKPGRCQYENAASRDKNVLLGKILRIEPDGSVPTDNPFTDPQNSAPCADEPDGRIEPGQVCQETYARGFRNPFRFAIEPGPTPRLFVNDVGGRRWEEIDNIKAGEDYGWNLCEGRHDNPDRRGRVDCNGPSFTGPIHEYSHKKTNCESITGGAFVPDDAAWPLKYRDAYLFGDFVCGKIFSLTKKPGGGYSRELFTRVPRPGPIAMAFGPNEGGGQALYYTTFAGEQNGQVRRIAPLASG